MTNARLQLVFLGKLVDGQTDAERVGAEKAMDDELVLMHDLTTNEVQRIERSVAGFDGPEPTPEPSAEIIAQEGVAAAASSAAAASAPAVGDTWTPFPVLIDPLLDEPKRAAASEPPAVAANPATARITRTAPRGLTPVAASTTRPRPQVRCPNCGERQTMRVICRGCASFLEVALKAKAERDAAAKSRQRPRGLFGMLGLS
jgi:hypothetical protein